MQITPGIAEPDGNSRDDESPAAPGGKRFSKLLSISSVTKFVAGAKSGTLCALHSGDTDVKIYHLS